jgi:hypothetical protein
MFPFSATSGTGITDPKFRLLRRTKRDEPICIRRTKATTVPDPFLPTGRPISTATAPVRGLVPAFSPAELRNWLQTGCVNPEDPPSIDRLLN